MPMPSSCFQRGGRQGEAPVPTPTPCQHHIGIGIARTLLFACNDLSWGKMCYKSTCKVPKPWNCNDLPSQGVLSMTTWSLQFASKLLLTMTLGFISRREKAHKEHLHNFVCTEVCPGKKALHKHVHIHFFTNGFWRRNGSPSRRFGRYVVDPKLDLWGTFWQNISPWGGPWRAQNRPEKFVCVCLSGP